MDCHCFFCSQNREHPARHKNFEEVSHYLKVPESLNPADIVRRESCLTCGHIRSIKEDN